MGPFLKLKIKFGSFLSQVLVKKDNGSQHSIGLIIDFLGPNVDL